MTRFQMKRMAEQNTNKGEKETKTHHKSKKFYHFQLFTTFY